MKKIIICFCLTLSFNAFSQYRILGSVSGDCNYKELTLVDSKNNPISITITDTSKKDKVCKWIDWANTKSKIANQIAIVVGLKSSNHNYALLSFEGNCEKRTFRIYDKSNKRVIKKDIFENCEAIDFHKTPAEIANQICEEIIDCEEL